MKTCKEDYAQYRSNSTALACPLKDDYYIHQIGKSGKKGRNSSYPVDGNPGKWPFHPLAMLRIFLGEHNFISINGYNFPAGK